MVHPSVCPSISLSFFHQSVRPSVCPCVRVSVRACVRPSVCHSFRPSICSSVRPSVRPSVLPSIRLSTRRTVCPSTRPSVIRQQNSLKTYPTILNRFTIRWLSLVQLNHCMQSIFKVASKYFQSILKVSSVGCNFMEISRTYDKQHDSNRRSLSSEEQDY